MVGARRRRGSLLAVAASLLPAVLASLLPAVVAAPRGRKLKRRMEGKKAGSNLGATRVASGPLHVEQCGDRLCRPGEGNLGGYAHWSMPWEPPPIDSLIKTAPDWPKGAPFPAARYTHLVSAARSVARENFVLFAAADFDFRELGENWYEGAKRAGMPNALLYALDSSAYAHFLSKSIPTTNGTANLNAWATTRLQRHIQRALAERHMAAAALANAGLDVLLSDTTHVFLRPVLPFFRSQPLSIDLFAMRGACGVKREPVLGCGLVWNFLFLRGGATDAARRDRVVSFVNAALDLGMVDFYLRWWAGHHCVFMGYVKTMRDASPTVDDPPGGPTANALSPNRTALISLRRRPWCAQKGAGCLQVGMLPHDLFPHPGAYHPSAKGRAPLVGRSPKPDLDPKRSHRLRLDRYDQKDFDDLRAAMVSDRLWLLPS